MLTMTLSATAMRGYTGSARTLGPPDRLRHNYIVMAYSSYGLYSYGLYSYGAGTRTSRGRSATR